MLGVTVAICCHNSEERLPATLRHLLDQQVSAETPWEVLIVDNASTDLTSQIARDNWPSSHSVPLRIVREPKPGLSNARLCAVQAAHYPLISFVDDDNWVAGNWVSTVAEIMEKRPEVAACFGKKESICETTPPWWFDRFEAHFVIGPVEEQAQDFTSRAAEIPGAGLNVRKSALEKLLAGGFEFFGLGRCGAKLSAGEDTELVCALRLAGWKLWYDPRLRLRHFLPAKRLSWDHLRRSHFGYGMSTVNLDPYFLCPVEPDPSSNYHRSGALRNRWIWQSLSVSKRLLQHHLRTFVLSRIDSLEGNEDALTVERLRGRLMGLLRTRGQRDANIDRVRYAAWRAGTALSVQAEQ